MKRSYGYDADKNLTELDIGFKGETIAQNRYNYDGNGNRVEKQQLRGTTYYSYDNLNQLTKASYPDYEEQLYYDKAGNRTKREARGIEETYRYDETNRLTSHEKAGIETAYLYDNAGNLLKDGQRTYKYDGFNRTTEVETKDGKHQINRYDAEGLRYEIEENGKLVKFIYNENDEIVTEETGENLKRLIRSFDLWASECTHEKTWYHYASDEQGSTIFIADEEEVKNRYEYDAWGNVTECEEQIENRYKYTGQQYDPITQQYYLRARYYNPVIARFTQEDVYRGDGLNLYAYCANNPVVYWDPSGYSGDPCKGKEVFEEQVRENKKIADAAEAAEKQKALNDALLKEYNRQVKKYGKGSVREMKDGKYRFYGEFKKARQEGEMAGARSVREWDPVTGRKRDWYETLDHSGNIRQVRPSPKVPGGEKVHYMFDEAGKYTGKWVP